MGGATLDVSGATLNVGGATLDVGGATLDVGGATSVVGRLLRESAHWGVVLWRLKCWENRRQYSTWTCVCVHVSSVHLCACVCV